MEQLLSVDDVCKIIQFKKSSVYALIHYKRIPYIKISGAVRFKRQDIEEWINTNTHKPHTPQIAPTTKKIGRAGRVNSVENSYVNNLIEKAKREVMKEIEGEDRK